MFIAMARPGCRNSNFGGSLIYKINVSSLRDVLTFESCSKKEVGSLIRRGFRRGTQRDFLRALCEELRALGVKLLA